jgi:hypothetical protein
MIEKLWENPKYFRLFLALYFLTLLFLLTTTPLSPSEAKIFYSKPDTPANIIAHLFNNFISGVLALRILSFLFGLLNIYLFYEISKDYFKRDEDVRFVLSIFMLTPAVFVSNIILNEAIVPTTMVLLFVIGYKRDLLPLKIISLIILFWSDTANFAFYFAILIFGYFKKRRELIYLGAIFLVISLLFGSYSFVGKPKGHLPELLALYAGLFSPLLFIYYFYALYRTALEGERDIFWYLSFIPLLISILLSIRQQILIVDFAPFLLLGLVIPAKVYLKSLRVRLKRFQNPYIFSMRILFFSMLFGILILVFHKPIYRALGSPKRFFVAPLYYPYDIAQELRAKGRECYDFRVRGRYHRVLKFYGFEECRPKINSLLEILKPPQATYQYLHLR